MSIKAAGLNIAALTVAHSILHLTRSDFTDREVPSRERERERDTSVSVSTCQKYGLSRAESVACAY